MMTGRGGGGDGTGFFLFRCGAELVARVASQARSWTLVQERGYSNPTTKMQSVPTSFIRMAARINGNVQCLQVAQGANWRKRGLVG